MDTHTTKLIAARAFEDGFREGVHARDLHYAIKRAEDAIHNAWFLAIGAGVWPLLAALRLATVVTPIQWVTLAVLTGGSGFGIWAIWWAKRERRRAVAAMDARKAKWRGQ